MNSIRPSPIWAALAKYLQTEARGLCMSQGVDCMHSTAASNPLIGRDQQLVQTPGARDSPLAASICMQVQSDDGPEFGARGQTASEFTGQFKHCTALQAYRRRHLKHRLNLLLSNIQGYTLSLIFWLSEAEACSASLLAAKFKEIQSLDSLFSPRQ